MKELFELRKLTGSINIRLKDTDRRWIADKKKVCIDIVTIVEKYMSDGYKLTLRQLYYQLVAGDLIPNHDTVYKKISSILDDLRYSGNIDWDAIEDRGRVPYITYSVEGIADAIDDAAKYFRLDRQIGQDNIVEVWTEKDAISGILKNITTKYHVHLVVNKGYSSSSAMYRAYQRFADQINEGKKITVLYFGDHDPSGLDMIRDVKERIEIFLASGEKLQLKDQINEWWEDLDIRTMNDDFLDAFQVLVNDKSSANLKTKAAAIYTREKNIAFIRQNDLFKVVPIGLTMDQIKEFNPPPNPAKLTDPRAKWYVREFGNISWEVDAISPQVMESIVDESIRKYIDCDKYDSMITMEASQRKEMKIISDKFK